MSAGQYGPAASLAADRRPADPAAWAYLLRCADGSLYAGWTNDLARRLRAHRSGQGWPTPNAAREKARPCAGKRP